MKALDRIARAAERKGLTCGQLTVAARGILERHISVYSSPGDAGGMKCEVTFDNVSFLEELAVAVERDGP